MEDAYLCELDSTSNPSHIVKLNVGGCRFTTTVSTLTAAGGYFESLFSGRWKQHLTEVGLGGLQAAASSPTPTSGLVGHPQQQL